MPTLNWIGKEKVVNHHVEVPFYTLERKYGFSGEDGGNKTGWYKYFMTYQHQGVEGVVAVNKLADLMRRM